MNAPRPREVRLLDDRVLAIVWSDDSVQHFAPEPLRAACPCAHCVAAGRKDPWMFREARVVDVETIGRYALRLVFSDGHEAGIYGFSLLRELGAPEGAAPPPPAPPPTFEV